MAQPSTNSDGVPLFACTKCNSRHPFEDLSQGHHLCKDCRGSFQVIKCNYCRDEFHQELNKGKTSSICKKCEQLQEQHGKPGPCAFCNIIAAFIGTKCQRCTNSEKKYGAPMPCEHCRQKCAFDRKDPESKKKVDGKLLCWLCTMAYKRTLAKARHKEAMLSSPWITPGRKSMASGSSANLSPKYSSYTFESPKYSSSSSFVSPKYTSSDWSSFDSHSSSHQRNKSKSSSVQSNKKQRLDHSSTNGQHHHHHMSSSNNHLTASIQSTNETRSNDSSNKDLVAVVTQLKDQVSNLNKRLIQKEKELLAKDQQIADLRSTNTREQREFREKMNTVQKQHTERVSELQAKLVSMQKQIVSHNKGTKATANPSSYVEPPLAM